jgi:UDP-N-acetylglucosamine 2-epimerase (non-hydrolysing)
MAGVEKVLMGECPDIVLVQGDTNTVLAGALAASKLHIKVGHVEAGLRSYDRTMPEEINRVVADHTSDYLFAPTENSRENLRREGISEEKIWLTGNTIVDAVYQNLEIARRKVNVLADLGLKPKEYFLVTAHRQENVDSRERLAEIIKGLQLVAREFGLPMVFPMHPRTRKMATEFGFEFDGVKVIDPLGFLEFLQQEANARLALTDSGGVQEETCILGVPCVTLRENTEGPETVDVGGIGWLESAAWRCSKRPGKCHHLVVDSEMLADVADAGLRIKEVEIGVRFDVDGSMAQSNINSFIKSLTGDKIYNFRLRHLKTAI